MFEQTEPKMSLMILNSCSESSIYPLIIIKTIVCKHWLRGLCKKGDQCEFLHEYDMSKMPECYFYTRFSEFDLWFNYLLSNHLVPAR